MNDKCPDPRLAYGMPYRELIEAKDGARTGSGPVGGGVAMNFKPNIIRGVPVCDTECPEMSWPPKATTCSPFNQGNICRPAAEAMAARLERYERALTDISNILSGNPSKAKLRVALDIAAFVLKGE